MTTGKLLHAVDMFQGKPDDSTCEEREPKSKAAVLELLREAGVPELTAVE